MTSLAQRIPPSTTVLHVTARGSIAAVAMTGVRTLTTEIGLVQQPPPEAILTQRVHRLLRLVPKGGHRAVIEPAHWRYGAFGGAMFGVLPERTRRLPWAGPVYGMVLWLGFEFGVAPLPGLSQARRLRATERVALAVDHLLYGLVCPRSAAVLRIERAT